MVTVERSIRSNREDELVRTQLKSDFHSIEKRELKVKQKKEVCICNLYVYSV